MASRYVLGIDLGTQALKTVFYDPDEKEIVSVCSVPLALRSPGGGVAEQEADWWLVAFRHAMAQTDADVRSRIVAIAVSGQQHGFVALNAAGEVIAPVKLWCDTSTEAECREITRAVGGRARSIELAGNPVLPGYTASKIRALAKNQPDTYERLATILLPHDYLNFYLTEERVMEAGDASGTGVFNVRNRRWSSAMLEAIDPERDLGECLPEVRTANGIIGRLCPAAADELGLPADTPVANGGGDNMMGAIGTGNVRPGTVTMSLGTSGTVYAYSDSPVVDPDGVIAAFCSSTGGWLPLLCTMNCTVSSELVRKLFDRDIEAFDAAVTRAPKGADGVQLLPWFNGERTPDLPEARAAFTGLTAENTRPDNLMRAAIEGATYALRFGVDELARLGIACEEIVLTGGGANSAAWRQLVADVMNRPVVLLEQTEGAAFGAALQALDVIETGASIEDLAAAHLARDESRCAEPDAGAAGIYSSGYEQYRRTAAAVATLYADGS